MYTGTVRLQMAHDGKTAVDDEEKFFREIYECFNARDVERVLAAMHEDVEWANGMEGGHVHGRAAVRDYWTRQWRMVSPHVYPVAFSRGPKGEIIIEVHQVVHDNSGHLLVDRMVGHIFRLEDGLIRRFDIRED